MSLLLAVIVGAATFQRPAVDLSERFKDGDFWVAQVRTGLRPDVDGDPEEVYVFRDQVRVMKRNDSAVLVTTRKLIESSVGGTSIPTDTKAPDIASRLMVGRTLHLNRETMDPGEYRLARLITLSWPSEPVEIGKGWSAEYKPEPVAWAPSAKATWTLAGFAMKLDRQVARVNLSYEEQGFPVNLKAVGELYLDTQTGIPLAYEIKATGAPAPGGDGSPNRYTYSYKVVELKLRDR